MTLRPPERTAAVMWLALAVALQLVANGRWIVGLAAWLAPIGWLVYLERSRPLRGFATAFPLYLLVQFVAWRAIIPAPGALYYLIAGTYALVYFLPFAVHRALAPRLAGVAATLVFPAAWVGIEHLFHGWVTPYGSWFSLAYTQPGQLALLQLASLTGTAGVSFVMAWFAATVAWLLRPGTVPRARITAAVTFATALVAVLAFGQIRLARAGPEVAAVRMAGLVPDRALMRNLETALAPVREGGTLAPAELDSVVILADRLNTDLLARTRREAQAGARLVAWSETAGRVLARDEAALLERARALAAEEGVDLILAYGVWDPDATPPLANRVTAVSAAGAVAWSYEKAHPIVGAESPFIRAGDGRVRALDTAWGRVGAVICHDLDFPALLRQARRERLDLVVGPSADWRAITPLHADMSVPRAIENGVALFRPTSGGRSLATDAWGRTVGQVDYAADVMVAHVPVARAGGALYGAVGDVFAWLCLAGLGGLVARRLVGSAASSRRTA